VTLAAAIVPSARFALAFAPRANRVGVAAVRETVREKAAGGNGGAGGRRSRSRSRRQWNAVSPAPRTVGATAGPASEVAQLPARLDLVRSAGSIPFALATRPRANRACAGRPIGASMRWRIDAC
jgi:hypothetical protein